MIAAIYGDKSIIEKFSRLNTNVKNQTNAYNENAFQLAIIHNNFNILISLK